MSMWKRPLLPSGKLSRPRRLVKALGHHLMQPNTLPGMQCTMLIKKLTRRFTRILPEVFRNCPLANQFRREDADVVGDKPVKNDAGEMSVSEDSRQKHYQRLLNVEFDWDPDHLSDEPSEEGPPIQITIDMVKKAISQIKVGKALGPSGTVGEMVWAAGDMSASMIRDLAAAIIRHIARYHLTGSRVSLSASTKVSGMHWKGKLPQSQADRSWKSWRGLWMASSDSWCQSTIWMADHRGKSKWDLTSWKWKLPFATQETCSQQLVAVNFQPQHVWKPPGKSSRSW